MLVATVIAFLGFIGVAIATRRYGVRLGGTIVIGVLAVYTLKNFSTLPIFIVSTVIAYLVLGVAKRRTLIFGRDELIVAVLAGSLLPAFVYLVLIYLPGQVQIEIYRSVFIGSLLSGIAAFNFHQIRPDYRRRDVLGAIGLYAGLLVLGALLVSPSTRFLAEYAPLVLFARTSDIAVYRGAVVEGFVDPAFVGRPFIIGVIALTLGLTEWIRNHHGIHVGTVALGLVAVYTVSTWRLLAMYLVATLVVTLCLLLIHRQMILYGRALLSTGAAIGILLVAPLSVALSVNAGISSLFVGVLSGLSGYYIHRTPPRERSRQFALATGVFTLLLVLVRAVIPPGPNGFPQAFGIRYAAAGIVVVLVAYGIARSLRVQQPSTKAVREASVFQQEGPR